MRNLEHFLGGVASIGIVVGGACVAAKYNYILGIAIMPTSLIAANYSNRKYQPKDGTKETNYDVELLAGTN